MRIKEVNVYTYGELSERAKDKVKHWLNDDDSFLLTDTLENDLSEFYKIPHAELSYSLSSCQGDGVSFTGRWENEEAMTILNKVYDNKVPARLIKVLPYFTLKFERISHQCAHEYTVQTELYSHRYYGKALAKFIESCEETINEWRIGICRELEKTGYAELEYQNSEECMIETCEANDYEFYANGDIA